mmetsp:Transcript_3624/g.6160  ORF Transcript_3624/g.6160 Transcript_3624/m.6160 type:complete len:264 (+) Transcript_3624:206-997(+)
MNDLSVSGTGKTPQPAQKGVNCLPGKTLVFGEETLQKSSAGGTGRISLCGSFVINPDGSWTPNTQPAGPSTSEHIVPAAEPDREYQRSAHRTTSGSTAQKATKRTPGQSQLHAARQPNAPSNRSFAAASSSSSASSANPRADSLDSFMSAEGGKSRKYSASRLGNVGENPFAASSSSRQSNGSRGSVGSERSTTSLASIGGTYTFGNPSSQPRMPSGRVAAFSNGGVNSRDSNNDGKQMSAAQIQTMRMRQMGLLAPSVSRKK